MFLQLERELIIQTTKSDDEDDISVEKVDTRPVGLKLDPDMPLRYHHIHLSPTWYASGKEKRSSSDKRKHRKTHGKIAFLDLSKLVASRWATLEEKDAETKDYCTRVAKRELDAYKVKVKEYKESLKYAPADSLPNSFSSASTGATLSSSGTSLSTFGVLLCSPYSSFTSAASPKRDNHGSSSSGGLTITTSNVSNFQICADFQPELLDRMHLDAQAPMFSSGGTLDTTSIDTSRRLSIPSDNYRDSFSQWRPDSLPDMMRDREQVSAPRAAAAAAAAWSRNSIGGGAATTSKNRRLSSRSDRSGMSRSMVSTPVAKGDFSFHPVECDSTDSFLKKYRKRARRTSLFSLRPLHQQVTPLNLNRSFTGGATTALSDAFEYDQQELSRGFGSLQMKLQDELDKRLAPAWKSGWGAKSRSSETDHDDVHCDTMNLEGAGRKRMSCKISEAYRRNSGSQMEFTCTDADMLLRALSDEKNPQTSL
jgi:hypothetical protein